MTDARPLLPIDIVSLVAYRGHSFRNEAWTRERLGADESARTLGMVLDQFLAFARGRNAWISARRGRLQGLVGARQRGGRQAWEVDYLIDTTPGREAAPELLECAIAETGRAGAEKLFLRLSAGSALLPAAREAGFMTYQEEVLYARGYSHDPGGEAASLRAVNPSDSYFLYRLYNLATPETTRRHEAATFSEWHAAQERRWLRNGVQLVAEHKGEVAAWVRAARLPQGVVAEVTVSESGLDHARGVVAAAATALDAAGSPLFVIVPRPAESLCRRLEEGGFSPRQDFVCLMRRTTRPLELPALKPVAVKNAVGA
ncbi:MAG: hypothetical protein GEU75_00175 [Dehalococcoidia bacterium]|nr:hypothetical protein [Dehalococcoidia bacterium]